MVVINRSPPGQSHGQSLDQWLDQLLGQLDLDDIADQYATTLSGGQVIRTALARCLLPRPALILADEPTASLDQTTAHQVSIALRNACDAIGATLIVATHDAELAAACDQHIDLATLSLPDKPDTFHDPALSSSEGH